MSTQNTETHYSWIKEVAQSLKDQDAVPLLAPFPPFPWEKMGESLAKSLNLPFPITLNSSNAAWHDPSDILKPFGENVEVLSLSLPPLEGHLHWAISRKDLSTFYQWILSKSQSSLAIHDEEFFRAFYHFLGSHFLFLLSQIPHLTGLGPTLLEHPIPISDPCFCLDVSLSTPDTNIQGRLILTKTLQVQWKNHLKDLNIKSNPDTRHEAASLPVSVEIGQLQLSLDDMNRLKPGDFLLLNNCNYNPDEHTGAGILKARNIPTFKGKVLPNGSFELQEALN